MPQQRIWDDPKRPKLTDFPAEIREAVIRRLARMAAQCIRGPAGGSGTEGVTEEARDDRSG